MSSHELVKRDNIEEQVGIGKLGEIFVKSGFFKDTRDQYQAVVKILYGRELGFSPVVSMMGVHIIDGKPSLSANLLGTLVKRSGKYNYRVKESTATRCEILFFEEKVEVGNSVFTIDDAKLAGVATKQNWTKYPKAMLFSRALSAGVKLHCPDVSACPLYVPEELGAEVNEDGDVQALPVSARAVPVTEAEIPIPPPKSAAGNKAQDGVVAHSNGHGAPSQAAEVPKGIPVDGADCISAGEAANFHRTFKDALPKKFQKDADELAHDWLRIQGILDVLGAPSAKAIKKASFYDVRDSAIEYAKTYNV